MAHHSFFIAIAFFTVDIFATNFKSIFLIQATDLLVLKALGVQMFKEHLYKILNNTRTFSSYFTHRAKAPASIKHIYVKFIHHTILKNKIVAELQNLESRCTHDHSNATVRMF